MSEKRSIIVRIIDPYTIDETSMIAQYQHEYSKWTLKICNIRAISYINNLILKEEHIISRNIPFRDLIFKMRCFLNNSQLAGDIFWIEDDKSIELTTWAQIEMILSKAITNRMLNICW